MKMSGSQILILTIIIIGGLIGTFIAAYQYWDSIKSGEENIQQQKKIVNNLTGDNNLPTIVIGVGTIGKENIIEYYLIDFQITNTSNSPIRGVKAYVWDKYSMLLNESIIYPEISDNNTPTFKGTIKPGKFESENNLTIGNLPPKNRHLAFYNAVLPQKIKEFLYIIKIEWDNGFVYFNLTGSNNQLNSRNVPILKVENYTDYLQNTTNKCVSILISK